jgi:hypothetical protein
VIPKCARGLVVPGHGSVNDRHALGPGVGAIGRLRLECSIILLDHP